MMLIHCKYLIVQTLLGLQPILFPLDMKDSLMIVPGAIVSAGRVFLNPLNDGIEVYGKLSLVDGHARTEDTEIIKRAYYKDV